MERRHRREGPVTRPVTRTVLNAAGILLLLVAPSCSDRSGPGNDADRSVSEEAKAFGKVEGLLRSEAGFVFSQDRCILSILFDNFRISLPKPAIRQKPDRLFTIAGGGGRPIAMVIKGALVGPARASIDVDIGGQHVARELEPSAEAGFEARLESRLAASGETPIRIAATLKGQPGNGPEALLDIDSVDIEIGPKAPCNRAAER